MYIYIYVYICIYIYMYIYICIHPTFDPIETHIVTFQHALAREITEKPMATLASDTYANVAPQPHKGVPPPANLDAARHTN